MIHFMIDIETLDTAVTAAIASIGICNSENDATLSLSLNCEVQVQLGNRTASIETLLWHLRTENYRTINFINAHPLKGALHLIDQYIREHTGSNTHDYRIWCKGSSFDFTILKDAYNQCNLPLSWNFRKERDLRTALDFAKLDSSNISRLSTEKEHTALGDALYQMRVLRQCLKNLNCEDGSVEV